jgi:MFS family permease
LSESSNRSSWTPLSQPLFRWLWLASIVSNVGTWMQNVGAAWLMTSLAPSALMVALVQTATYLPVFILGIPAGAVADIVDRRKLLILTQAWMLLAAAILGGMTIAGVVGPWSLLWLTFALGLGSTMNAPAWQAIIPELVPRSDIPAAIALNSVGFNLARAAGPALGGLAVATMGAGGAFILNAVSFIAVIAVLYFWQRAPEYTTTLTETVGSAMTAGLRYVRFAPAMHGVLWRSGSFVIAASGLWALLPILARVELHSESTGYGLMLGCLGVGSILGAFLVARLRRWMSPEILVTVATVAFGLSNIALAYLERFSLVAVALLVGGAGWMIANSTLNTAAQTSLPAWVRARALSVYLLVFQSAMALGGVIWGVMATRFGLRTTLLVAGISLLVVAAATFHLRLHSSAEADVAPSAHWPEPHLLDPPDLEQGPVLVQMEYQIAPDLGREFAQAMQPVGQIRRRDGAIRWSLWEDAAEPGRYIETFVVANWAEHLRQHERITVADRAFEEKASSYHVGPAPPRVTHLISARSRDFSRDIN